MTADTPSAPCGVCGATRWRTIARTIDDQHGTPGSFAFAQCLVCSHVQSAADPEIALAAYPADYAAHEIEIGREPNRLLRWNRRLGLSRRCALVESRVRAGRILDVGCGRGHFLAAMSRRGWSVLGVEPSARAAARAREEYGLPIHAGTLRDMGRSAEFDVVTLWHVLEHVTDPAALLDDAWHVLRPDGLVVIETPNVDSVDRRLFGRHWTGWDPPRHLHLFGPRILAQILVRHGFTEVDVQCRSGSWMGLSMSLRNLARSRGLSTSGMTGDGALHLQAARALATPYLTLIDRLRLGSVITAMARSSARAS